MLDANSTSSTSPKQLIPGAYDTYDSLLEDAFDMTAGRYLDPVKKLPPKREFTNLLMGSICVLIEMRNKQVAKELRWRGPKTLSAMPVAKCVNLYHDVIAIEGEDGTRMLAIYVDDPSNADYGTYVTDECRIRAIAREFNGALTRNEAKEVIACLYDIAPTGQLTTDSDLLPMKNGVFNYKTKVTMPFSPEFVFLRKYPVSIPEHHIDEPAIAMPDGKLWTFTGWLEEVIEDEATREVVWDVLGALLRPHVNWLKIAFLIGKGRNGKGTLIELMRALVGRPNCAALSLKHFSKKTELVPLLGALANIADENDDSFIPTSELVKAIADHNAITVRRLYENPYTFRPHLFNVQAMNELPVFKDKSDGMHSRILAIEFTKQFLRGKNDNVDIKDTYIVDPDVVAWVAYHALVERPDYYVLGSSSATNAALASYRVETDPVAAFWTDEVRENVIGCFLPYSFLYAWYIRWMRETNPSGHPVDQRKFTPRIKEMAAADGWVDAGGKRSCNAWTVDFEPHASKYAKRRYDSYLASHDYDENDQLARWYTSSRPTNERGLVLAAVDEWCAAHGTKPREFVQSHAKPPARHRCFTKGVTSEMLTAFIAEVVDGSIDYNAASYEFEGWD